MGVEMKLATFLIIGLFSHAVFADSAQIRAEGVKPVRLDAKGVPRIEGDPKSYPTIKDFREDSDYSDPCYEGSASEAKALLEALIEAANGDGDSWAELVRIDMFKSKTIKVTVKITDEGGENEEEFEFPVCR